MNTLEQHRDIWQRKAVLRRIYADYYRRIAAWARPGTTLEIGGGSGNLKAFMQDLVSTDIQFAPWLDIVADAQQLPFADGSFANLVAFDVVHHIERPYRLLDETRRLLRPGGRLIVLEPLLTPISRLIYRRFHPEPFDFDVDPLEHGSITPARDPYSANQALPMLLFGRERERLQVLFPELSVIAFQRLALWTYPLSGGFRPWSLIPAAAIDGLLWLEDRLLPLLGPAMAFRMLGVIERK